MKRYPYFPGCAVKGTSRAYEESLLACCEALDVELVELEDWNCCGATAYMSVDEDQALALASRNLALAEEAGGDLVTPCNACYLVLNKTQRALDENPGKRKLIGRALTSIDLVYRGTARVRHPLDILMNDIGRDAIRSRVTRLLEGLKVAPYYGCQIVRPYALFDSQDDPQTMDMILEATGAEVIDFPHKTRCCGGSQTGTLPEVGRHLVYELLHDAKLRGAHTVATVCPLCQFNLEAYQDRVAAKYEDVSMPIVYVTQLLGLALGIAPKKLGLDRAIVPAEPVLMGGTTHATAD